MRQLPSKTKRYYFMCERGCLKVTIHRRTESGKMRCAECAKIKSLNFGYLLTGRTG